MQLFERGQGMSIRLMAEVWPLDLPLGKKFVLIALCDSAHDEGECFLCIETIAYKCGMGVRTVQQHLSDLEADGFIRREERAGRSSLFSVYPLMLQAAPRHPLFERRQEIRDRMTPAKSAGVNQTPAKSAPPQGTPAEAAPSPAKSAGAPAKSAPITVLDPSTNGKKNNLRGTRIPDDWSITDELMQAAIACGVPPGAVQVEAEQFRDHWKAKTGKDATALDWPARWRTWCRNAVKWTYSKNNKGGTTHDQRAATIAALTGRDREQGNVIDSTAHRVD